MFNVLVVLIIPHCGNHIYCEAILPVLWLNQLLKSGYGLQHWCKRLTCHPLSRLLEMAYLPPQAPAGSSATASLNLVCRQPRQFVFCSRIAGPLAEENWPVHVVSQVRDRRRNRHSSNSKDTTDNPYLPVQNTLHVKFSTAEACVQREDEVGWPPRLSHWLTGDTGRSVEGQLTRTVCGFSARIYFVNCSCNFFVRHCF